MKTHIIYWAIGLLMINTLSGQVKIGDNPQSIHPASILELESNTGALVISRVTTAEMNNIVPLVGAMVYNIEEDCLHYYNGTEWVNLCEDNRITFSTLALFNPTSRDSTVVIISEDTPDGINYNFEVNKITSENIANNTVLREDLSFGIIGQQQLQDGAVTNPKLDKANIPLSGFGIPTADVSMGNAARITNLVNPTAPQDAATMSYVDARADDDITGVIFTPATNQLTVNEGTTTFSADLSALEESADIATNAANITANTTTINDHIADDLDLDITNEIQNIEEVLADGNNANGAVITGLGTPTAATDAATKAYVDTEIAASNQTIVSADAGNSITESGTDGGAFYDDSTLQTAVTDNTTAINNHIAADGDLSGTNEINTRFEVNGTNLEIEDPNGTLQVALADITAGVNTDNQDISTNGTPGNIEIDNGSTINLNVDDADASDTNEINTRFEVNGTNLEIEDPNGTLQVALADINNQVVVSTDANNSITLGGDGGAFVNTTVKPIISVSTDFTLDDTHYTVILEIGVTTVTLPASVAANTGRIYILKNRTGGVVNTSINYIDSTGASVNEINNVVVIQSDGAGNWEQIN